MDSWLRKFSLAGVWLYTVACYVDATRRSPEDAQPMMTMVSIAAALIVGLALWAFNKPNARGPSPEEWTPRRRDAPGGR